MLIVAEYEEVPWRIQFLIYIYIREGGGGARGSSLCLSVLTLIVLSLSLSSQFLTKDIGARLGSGPSGEANIKGHPFFACIDWEKLEQRKVEPPFKPQVVRFP